MKRRLADWRKIRKHGIYCDRSPDEVMDVIMTLGELEDRIEMTDKEQDAMDIAIQAVCDIRNAMVGDGKIHWEWY